MIVIKHDDWLKEGEKRYGEHIEDWKFICPICKKISSGQEFKDLGAKANDIPQICIGRLMENPQSAMGTKNIKGIGCDFAAFGLFRFAPITVIFEPDPSGDTKNKCDVFDFADDPLTEQKEAQNA